jgi:alpha-amylase/alpha-mannosidase (GH57 family)
MTADMSEEAIAQRKLERQKEQLLAEQAWENMNNEGTSDQREYWMHGYKCGMNSNKFILSKEAKEGLLWSGIFAVGIIFCIILELKFR